jgi:hypothetical protein
MPVNCTRTAATLAQGSAWENASSSIPADVTAPAAR